MTEALRAHYRLITTVLRDRIRTHEREPPARWGDHWTLEQRLVMLEKIKRCKEAGWTVLQTANRLNLDHKTVKRWWNESNAKAVRERRATNNSRGRPARRG